MKIEQDLIFSQFFHLLNITESCQVFLSSQNTFLLSNENSFDDDSPRGKGKSSKQDLPVIRKKSFSDDFVDTEDMCRDLKNLKCVPTPL